MKLLIKFLPLLLVILGVLNYMYFAKDIASSAVLLSLGGIVAIFNIIRKVFKIAFFSIAIVIVLVGLFSYLVHSGI